MKYRKKPVVIDAEPYREGLEDGWDIISGELVSNPNLVQRLSDKTMGPGGRYQLYEAAYINTLEGKHYISKNDYIVTGIKGEERYPVKKDIFEATYEKVEGEE